MTMRNDGNNLFLGINTAVEPLSIGFVENGDILAEVSLKGSYDFSENLNVEINNLCEKASRDLKNIKAIGVVNGPGAYTGIRLGVTVAKTMGQILKIPVFPIDTLKAIVFHLRSFDEVYFSVIPARVKEINCALFSVCDQEVQRLTDNYSWSYLEMIKKLREFKEKVYIAGLIPKELQDDLKLENIRIEPVRIRGSVIAQMAENAFLSGQNGDYLKVFSAYSHMPIMGKIKNVKK